MNDQDKEFWLKVWAGFVLVACGLCVWILAGVVR
jgi:hypothetical protein